jgi:hypothetical protein
MKIAYTIDFVKFWITVCNPQGIRLTIGKFTTERVTP